MAFYNWQMEVLLMHSFLSGIQGFVGIAQGANNYWITTAGLFLLF